MNKDRILIVEDDREIRNLLSGFLTENDYEVVTAAEGSAASKIMKEQTFTIILMDLMLPYKSGDELIKELREYSDTPVIVVVGKIYDRDKVRGASVGADDYIIKPFDLDEVLVRIEVVLRRSGGGNACGISKGAAKTGDIGKYDGAMNLTADKITSPDGRLIYYTGENRVAFDDNNLTLTAKEMALLHLFLQYPTKTYTKANLYEAVWNDTYYYEDNTINVHMSNLRSKLKKQTGNDYIETVWGIGYRLKEQDG